MAKFAFYPARESVREAAKNLEVTSHSIGQQFLKEIQDRRRRLVPIMKKAKEEGKQAYISVDQLHIDGIQYVVETDPVGRSRGYRGTRCGNGDNRRNNMDNRGNGNGRRICLAVTRE